jgi:hypothetical protein
MIAQQQQRTSFQKELFPIQLDVGFVAIRTLKVEVAVVVTKFSRFGCCSSFNFKLPHWVLSLSTLSPTETNQQSTAKNYLQLFAVRHSIAGLAT